MQAKFKQNASKMQAHISKHNQMQTEIKKHKQLQANTTKYDQIRIHLHPYSTRWGAILYLEMHGLGAMCLNSRGHSSELLLA